MQAYHQLREVYRALRLVVNCFQPSLKLQAKVSKGDRIHRVYDVARTPLERLLASGVLSETRQEDLRARAQQIDPLTLSEQLDVTSASRRKDKRHQKTAMHTVAILLYDAVNPFELAVATEIFGFERPELKVLWYRFLVCAVEARPIRSVAGLTLSTPYTLQQVSEADTVIVPSTRPGVVPIPDVLLDTLRQAYQRGARLISFCTGTFVLAAAGLLDGRRATTHWLWTAELAARYPLVRVDPQVLYIDGGQILTSAGTAASIDLSLHVVRQDYGATIAAAVARRMVVLPYREGGQAQYIEVPLPDLDEELFNTTLTWMVEHVQEELTVEQMAGRAGMSPRTFARRFRATFGTTPYQWLLQQRIAQAQRLLESTNLPVEHIATRCGFSSAATLRLHFHRLRCVSPQAYRAAFQQKT